jgi:hypothetical protein
MELTECVYYNAPQHTLNKLFPPRRFLRQHHSTASLLASLLCKHRHTGTTTSSGLGVLALHLEAPVVTQAPAQTQNVKHACGHYSIMAKQKQQISALSHTCIDPLLIGRLEQVKSPARLSRLASACVVLHGHEL